MSQLNSQFSVQQKLVAGIIFGIIVGALTMFVTLSNTDILGNSPNNAADNMTHEHNSDKAKPKEPLYWVAPMDPNFRRDKPGKSPMGMDLVPVYASDSQTGKQSDSPGTVRIDANVINNLGVKTVTAKLRPLNSDIHTVGLIRYNEDTLVHIHPRVEGWVEELYVKAAGDYVTKGQALYSLYSPELVNAQEEYLLAVQRGSKALINAAQSRLSALQVPSDVISKLNQTKKVEQKIVFKAAQTGFVDNLNIRQGFFVKPGTTLMSIGALDEVWVDADVFARDAAKLALGQRVSMTLDYAPGKLWEGTIDYIYPSLDSQTRTLRARVRFNNPDYQLKPNMYANLRIHTEQDSDAVLPKRYLLVPSQAVIRTGRQNRVVLALGEGKFKSIEVTLGRMAQDMIEITSGLRAGDEIVSSAQFLIDSQSAIDSDFMRMQPASNMQDMSDEPESVMAQATINKLIFGDSAGEHKINLSHEALDAWNMPAMTMDFMLAETIDIQNLREGMQIHATIVKQPSGMYEVTDIHIMSPSMEGM
ncbi:efflux RND transporter periplasmic adaptor subunit [Glaciecola siphonariae]|uniref:Efflux RND transporter periplasmic adaptor subunit n=1 Tax=Glaciecola siphonariae TaxID=521012 RepID=A0ABV9M0W1_9ALTE